jgi:sigma-B regulation protein RsbU (phosphoserine phosphatase)
LVKVKDVNAATLELYAAHGREEFRQRYYALPDEKAFSSFAEELVAIAEGKTRFECETVARTTLGEKKEIILRWSVAPGYEECLSRVWVSTIDCTDQKRALRALQASQAQMLAAQQIQERFLPEHPPRVAGFDIAAAVYPAEFAAGDYFDYLAMPDGRLGLVVADVSGHGFAPALLMASVHTLVRSIASVHCDIDQIVTRANRVLMDTTEDDRFVTLLFGLLDPQTRSFAYTSAGHPTGYLLGASGNVKSRLESTGLPLGILRDAEFYAGNSLILDPGDLVLMVTDGIQEVRSAQNELFGTKRLLEVVHANRDRSAREVIEALYQAVCDFSGGEKPTDDVTAMVVKVEAAP